MALATSAKLQNLTLCIYVSTLCLRAEAFISVGFQRDFLRCCSVCGSNMHDNFVAAPPYMESK